MKKITRRDFLKKSLCAGTVLTLNQFGEPLIHACAEKKLNSSIVSVMKGTDIGKITGEALDMIGGVKKIIKAGQRVFIKPNYIAGGFMGHDPVSAGEIPHPEVVATVAKVCVEAGAREVLIGEWFERPLVIEFGGREGREGAQIKHHIDLLNKKYGERIFLIDLRKYTKNFIYVPSKSKIRWLAIPDVVALSDVVISLAVLKTHHWPIPVTLGMKNFMGIMPSELYGEPRIKLHDAGIHQVIIDINKGIKPKLTVISGVYGMEGEGVVLSFGGKPVDISSRLGGYLVIAGYDSLATDATAVRIITKNWQPRPVNEDLGVPWYVHHLRGGFQQGLGEIRKSRIEIRGCILEEVSMSWKMPVNNTYPELPGNV